MESKSEMETVKVVVRCRPMSEKEQAANYHSVVRLHSDRGAIDLLPPTKTGRTKSFTFDAVYDGGSQREVYDEVFRPLVESVLGGFNGTIFAYGQTGAGKTYTMEGGMGPGEEGVIPQSFRHVFSHIAQSGDDSQFLVCASYLEIYQEEVRDLLSPEPKQKLEVRERNDTGVYVKDLTVQVCRTVEDLEKALTRGRHNRSIGTTNMNVHSSRSHAIFIISIESCECDSEGNKHVKTGKLNLVDLAGSEKQAKTGAVGCRQKESIKINLSLSALGNVISALVDGKSTHVPYRDSKLTRLLQDSLGGNAKTIMLAAIGPASWNHEETLTTLRYAHRAKNIKNAPRRNVDLQDATLLRYQQEILALRAQLDARRSSKRQRKDTMQKQSQENQEKEKLLLALAEQEEGLRAEKEGLEAAIAELEAKLLSGGGGAADILDRTQEQQQMLEKQRIELAAQKRIEVEMRAKLADQEEGMEEVRGTYTSLQEEVEAKGRKLRKLFVRLQALKEDINDEQEINSFERQEKEQAIEALSRDLKLSNLVLENFVSGEERAKFLEQVRYDDDEDAWIIYPADEQAHMSDCRFNPASGRPTINARPQRKNNKPLVDLFVCRRRTIDSGAAGVPAPDPFVRDALLTLLRTKQLQCGSEANCTPRQKGIGTDQYPVPRGLVPK